MPENNEVQEPIRQFAESTGWLVRLIEYRNRRNCPDMLCIKNGVYVWMECKILDKDARIGQEREIKRLRMAGAEVHVVDRAQKGIDILDRYNRRDR